MEISDLVKWVVEIDEIPAGWPLNQLQEKGIHCQHWPVMNN